MSEILEWLDVVRARCDGAGSSGHDCDTCAHQNFNNNGDCKYCIDWALWRPDALDDLPVLERMVRAVVEECETIHEEDEPRSYSAHISGAEKDGMNSAARRILGVIERARMGGDDAK
jgi:hypothetical protein